MFMYSPPHAGRAGGADRTRRFDGIGRSEDPGPRDEDVDPRFTGEPRRCRS